MGRAPCCDKTKVKRGPWSPEEDNILKNYLEKNGIGGNWIALPQKAGLRRCGKSCRLRWLNYLRPDIKHGGFTEEEDNIILTLYNQIGSRWSVIAANLHGRTDNDVKNHWNTKLKKKLLASQNTNLITNNNNIISSDFNHNYSRNYDGILENYSSTFTSHMDTNLTNYSSCDQFPFSPLMEIQENDATIQVEDGYNPCSSEDNSLKMLSHRPCWNNQKCAIFKGPDTIQSVQVDHGYKLCSLDDSSNILLHPCWTRRKCTTFEGFDTPPSMFLKNSSNKSCYDLGSGISSSSSYYDDILENGFDFQENAMGVDDPNTPYYNILEIDQLFKGFEN
ncbi:unnamed protein product [Withania somnifera]